MYQIPINTILTVGITGMKLTTMFTLNGASFVVIIEPLLLLSRAGEGHVNTNLSQTSNKLQSVMYVNTLMTMLSKEDSNYIFDQKWCMFNSCLWLSHQGLQVC